MSVQTPSTPRGNAAQEAALYCALVPLAAAGPRALLLPNAVIAETLSADRIEPVPDAAQAVVGFVRHETRQLPVLSIEALVGVATQPSSRSRVVVLHPLVSSESDAAVSKQPAFALLASGYPHLVAVTPTLLTECALLDDDIACAALARVRIGHTEALIPDLDRLQALAYAVPAALSPATPAVADW